MSCKEGLFQDAGCASGDAILSINGQSVSEHEVASTILARIESGSTITLRIARMLRGDKIISVNGVRTDDKSKDKIVALLAQHGAVMFESGNSVNKLTSANPGLTNLFSMRGAKPAKPAAVSTGDSGLEASAVLDSVPATGSAASFGGEAPFSKGVKHQAGGVL